MAAPRGEAQARTAASRGTLGSATTTTSTSDNNARTRPHIRVPPSGTLRLRGEPTQEQQPQEQERRVQWAEDVVNNEGMGKKSSKVCCIYHKPRPVDESSDESDSSSSDDQSDSGDDDGGAKPSKENKDKQHRHDQKHQHGCDRDKSIPNSAKRPPNAYEHEAKNT